LLLAARSGDGFGAGMALLQLTSALGTNLISDQIQRWKDEASREPEVAHWLQENVGQSEALRAEIDVVLEKLDALALARTVLSDHDRDWFSATLRRELADYNNLERFQASVVGDRNVIVQGEGNTVTFTIIEQQVIAHYAPDPRELANEAASIARGRYLTRLAHWCNALPLIVLGADSDSVNELSLDHVYVELQTDTSEPCEASGVDGRESSQIDENSLNPADPSLRRLSVQEMAAQSSRLVLLGEPGSGKSTFVRH